MNIFQMDDIELSITNAMIEGRLLASTSIENLQKRRKQLLTGMKKIAKNNCREDIVSKILEEINYGCPRDRRTSL